MARRRIFRTRLKCADELEPPYHDRRLVGCEVSLERSSDSDVNVKLGGAIVARLDGVLGLQVASAIDRVQAFTAMIENTFPIYNEVTFTPTGMYVDIKVEYLLVRGQPAIDAPRAWRCVDPPQKPTLRNRSSPKLPG